MVFDEGLRSLFTHGPGLFLQASENTVRLREHPAQGTPSDGVYHAPCTETDPGIRMSLSMSARDKGWDFAHL